MPVSIRNFRNTDVVDLCAVWNSHYADQGFACHIDPQRIELCCLAKPYFDPRELFVAEQANEVVGFMHLGSLANATLTESQTDTAAISALCVMHSDQEEATAADLLAAGKEYLVSQGRTRCQFKPMLPDASFYLGFGPADSMIGATAIEQRSCQWVSQAGFKPVVPTTLWELDLSVFQPPMDRTQIQIRRSAHVGRQMEEPELPWWQACILGHTEPIAFDLTHRAERRVLHDVLFWTVAPELQTVPESVASLWPPNVPDDEQERDQLLFLLAESMRALQADRLDQVRTVTAAHENHANAMLKRLGFSPVQSGVVFEVDYRLD